MRGNGLDWKTTTSSKSHDGMSGVAAFRRTRTRVDQRSATSDARQLKSAPSNALATRPLAFEILVKERRMMPALDLSTYTLLGGAPRSRLR